MKRIISIVVLMFTFVAVLSCAMAESDVHPAAETRSSCIYGCGNLTAFRCKAEFTPDGTSTHKPVTQLWNTCTISWYNSTFYEYCHYCERTIQVWSSQHICQADHSLCNDVIWCTAEFRDRSF